jgi:hypothetical protein
VVAETQKGLVRFLVAVFLHVPSWRSVGKRGLVQLEVVSSNADILRAEVDSQS